MDKDLKDLKKLSQAGVWVGGILNKCKDPESGGQEKNTHNMFKK